MLIHPWDAATGSAEWQGWLTATDRFGMLAVNNLDPARAPQFVCQPTVVDDPPGKAEILTAQAREHGRLSVRS